MNKLRVFSTFLILYAVGLGVGCDTKITPETLEKWQKAGENFQTYSRQASNIVYGLYEAKIISPEFTAQIYDNGFLAMDRGGIKFYDFVKEKLAAYGENAPPQSVIDEIKAALRSNVVEKFLEVLEKLKVIKISAELKQTIVAIKTAVLVFADALQIGDEVKAEIKAKEKNLCLT
jgi:hypothetical protein